MLKSKKVAITGGMATGKSTVCDFLEKLGCFVIRTDTIVHNILKPDSTCGKHVIDLLGRQIIDNGHFNRQKIAELVFNDKAKLKALEEIIHPVVFNEIKVKTSEVTNQYPCIIVEIPLLFETGQEKFFDYVIAVISDKSNCLKRLEEKGLDKDEYERRMKFQLGPEDKSQNADFTIVNNEGLDKLEEKIKQLYQNLLAA